MYEAHFNKHKHVIDFWHDSFEEFTDLFPGKLVKVIKTYSHRHLMPMQIVLRAVSKFKKVYSRKRTTCYLTLDHLFSPHSSSQGARSLTPKRRLWAKNRVPFFPSSQFESVLPRAAGLPRFSSCTSYTLQNLNPGLWQWRENWNSCTNTRQNRL